MIDKWTSKYMKIAKALADDNEACFSRKIGVVIISPDNTPISFGYNGTPRKCPHVDSKQYLEFLWQKLLTDNDKNLLETRSEQEFISKYENCRKCPRRLLNIPSGERMELCNCAHAERNALANASIDGKSTKDCTMYCWCPLPCMDCTIQIIQSRIEKVVCLKSEKDYSPTSRKLLGWSNIKIFEINMEDLI